MKFINFLWGNLIVSRVAIISQAVHFSAFSAATLIEQVGSVFEGLPDNKSKSNNNKKKYAMKDASFSVFSGFFAEAIIYGGWR